MKPLLVVKFEHPAPAVHADLDVMLFQKSREIGARKLRALVRVENLRLIDLKRLPNGVQTEARVQRRRKLPISRLTRLRLTS